MTNRKKKQRPQLSSPSFHPPRGRREVFAAVRRGIVAVVDAPMVLMPPGGGAGVRTDFSAVTILGTGFIADPRGIVVTAGHVIDPFFGIVKPGAPPLKGTPHILVPEARTSSGDAFEYELYVMPISAITRLKGHDAAFLTLTRSDAMPAPLWRLIEESALRLSNVPCEEGDEVATCGYPFGLQLHGQLFGGAPIVVPSFSQGIVSAVLPHTSAPPVLLQRFQIDAMINGGNSGGPVFDPATGTVLGIITDAVTGTIKNVVTKGQTQTAAPGSGAAADAVIDVQVPTGLALGLHVHQLFAGLRELRDQLDAGRAKS